MKESREDYTRVMRGRYARHTGKPARAKLLDEYCQTTGLERKYANKVLRGQRRRGPSGVLRGASSRYTRSDLQVLKSLWLAAGQPCGKRLAGDMLKLWLGSWQKHHRALSQAQRKRIEQISAAQIDRELAPYRIAGRKRRIASSALATMQREVAVRCEPWAETAPGAIVWALRARGATQRSAAPVESVEQPLRRATPAAAQRAATRRQSEAIPRKESQHALRKAASTGRPQRRAATEAASDAQQPRPHQHESEHRSQTTGALRAASRAPSRAGRGRGHGD